eukprot:1159621-Pelagomonas_calceolata.AAC.10
MPLTFVARAPPSLSATTARAKGPMTDRQFAPTRRFCTNVRTCTEAGRYPGAYLSARGMQLISTLPLGLGYLRGHEGSSNAKAGESWRAGFARQPTFKYSLPGTWSRSLFCRSA